MTIMDVTHANILNEWDLYKQKRHDPTHHKNKPYFDMVICKD